MSLFFVAGAGVVYAGSCQGVKKASSSKGACTHAQKASGPACSGVVKQAFSGSCSPGCASAAAGCSKSKTTQAMYTVQLLETKEGFRVSVVGCKAHGRDLLEKSVRVLHERHQLEGEIQEAKDGLYLDVQGETAKGVVHQWQAMSGSDNCLLSTEEGECLIGADALASATG